MRLPVLEELDGQSIPKISHGINVGIPQHVPPASSEVDNFQHVVHLHYPPTVRLWNVQSLSGHAHSLYLLKLSNGHQLIMKSSPPSAVPLLRRERLALETEARALVLLKECAHPLIPQILHYASEDTLLGAAFLLRRYVKGTSLLHSRQSLSREAYNDIDHNLGLLVNVIAQQVSTAFGSLSQVAAGAGYSSWRQSFISLFEEVLRDAEDMFIHLPYGQLREQLRRLAPALDEITTPRLVIVNFGRPSDALFDLDSKKLSGVLDFGSAIWGDVLMAEIFEFIPHALLDAIQPISLGGRSRSIRFLLYSCYRHVYNITVLNYRSRTDDPTEILARRKLTEVLQAMGTAEAN